MENMRMMKKRNYEEIIRFLIPSKKGKQYTYLIDNDYYFGFFTINEMIDFKECNLGRKQLSKRINNLIDKEGQYFTLWNAISTETNTKPESTNKIETKRSKIQEKEFYEFLNLMNSIPVGSLSDSVR